MGILDWLGSLFTGKQPKPQRHDADVFYFFIRLERSEEVVRVRLDLNRDLTPEDYDDASISGYFCVKSIYGPHSRRRAQAILRFDRAKALAETTVEGGTLSTEEAWRVYEASLQPGS